MGATTDTFLETVGNLSRYHREHEKYYSREPLEQAAALQRTSMALRALAERWSVAAPERPVTGSPFAGARDLNDDRATELAGILFMEGEGEPAEIARIKRELAASAADDDASGAWLERAMEAAWGAAELLLDHPAVADLLGERHRIVANDWLAATQSRMAARHLQRSVAILERIDFSPAALRADLAGGRDNARYLYSATELIDRAADLAAESSTLVHENERRWRVFHQRVTAIAEGGG